MTDLDKLEAPRSAFYNEMRRQGYKTMDIAEIDDRALCDAIINAHLAAQRQGGDAVNAADYEGTLADHRRLVRELDVLLCGDGAAKQASLCDIVGMVADWKRKGAVFPPAVTGDRGGALEWFNGVVRNIETIAYLDGASNLAIETIRAALLSAQGGVPGDLLRGAQRKSVTVTAKGVPGDVVEKVYAAIDDAIPFVGYQASVPEKIEALLNALTLLTPYLNNGRGG